MVELAGVFGLVACEVYTRQLACSPSVHSDQICIGGFHLIAIEGVYYFRLLSKDHAIIASVDVQSYELMLLEYSAEELQFPADLLKLAQARYTEEGRNIAAAYKSSVSVMNVSEVLSELSILHEPGFSKDGFIAHAICLTGTKNFNPS